VALGSRCAALGQLDLAVSIYRDFLREAAVADHELVAVASYRLADIYRERGELREATALFVRAFRDGSVSLKPHAAIALGDLIREQGCPDAAKKLYSWVFEVDHADLAPQAGYQLAEIHRESGDQVDAIRVLRAVALSGHPLYGPMAEEDLLPMIGELDVSKAVDGMVEEVLGAGQMQLGPNTVHSYYAASPFQAQVPVRQYHGVLLVSIMLSPRRVSQPQQAPLQLEAGKSKRSLSA